MAKAINIILKPDTGTPDTVFIEIENDDGHSVRVGEYVIRDDGYNAIRITPEDIQNLPGE